METGLNQSTSANDTPFQIDLEGMDLERRREILVVSGLMKSDEDAQLAAKISDELLLTKIRHNFFPNYVPHPRVDPSTIRIDDENRASLATFFGLNPEDTPGLQEAVCNIMFTPHPPALVEVEAMDNQLRLMAGEFLGVMGEENFQEAIYALLAGGVRS